MALNDKFEVKITGMYNGDIWQNVLHYLQTVNIPDSGITQDIGALHTAVAADVLTKIQACQCAESTIMSVRIQQVGVADPVIERRGYNLSGEAGDLDPLPASDAVLFQKRCNVGGRRNVGSLYLSCVPEQWVTGSLVDVTEDALEALMVQLKTGIGELTGHWRPVIWHRADNSAEFVTITGIRPQISRQNRRHIPVL